MSRTQASSDAEGGISSVELPSFLAVSTCQLFKSSTDSDPESSDAESASPSVAYGHGPLETFRNCVLEYALELWRGVSPNQVNVELIAGKEFNRIVGFSKQPDGHQEETQYILRDITFCIRKG
ncbi:uncharacterized protein Z518_06133 [Rhinocladiella mackenziei CBS 650.93]|uniref:Uncharacterized protein n=1 Tax=Rhinocladiella mackenziei CBS 650.93 TaxID=1442369 RepID=A0A0D2IPZ9_9EURO|nr:uncharacterized protein Z518_06133 [Rhinocladiella mackenziei CBS 650.93]KIX05261.1 hypothetical protein Z518_06133 [Rhinocladiella mackenziei CBS 650.93]